MLHAETGTKQRVTKPDTRNVPTGITTAIMFS